MISQNFRAILYDFNREVDNTRQTLRRFPALFLRELLFSLALCSAVSLIVSMTFGIWFLGTLTVSFLIVAIERYVRWYLPKRAIQTQRLQAYERRLDRTAQDCRVLLGVDIRKDVNVPTT